MDQLIQHCLRELSFDGDLGCSAARLKDYIVTFHAQEGAPQAVDDAYCAFVWSLMAQTPTVHIGVIPTAIAGNADVAIAPQPSKNRGAKGPASTPPGLEVIEDGKSRPFSELIALHGEHLRIAADPETTFAAITGSHHRPAALTPMVYTVLQLITRGREHGTSTVTIGRTTGYDQKTVFYLVSKLVALDLVLKLRKPGTAMYFCVHRYFYEQSEYWKDVRKEESRAQCTGTGHSKQRATSHESEEENSDDNEDSGFKPLDRRHLTSLVIVRARLMKLLERCANGMHVARNLITAVGFANPVKPDRRLFATHVRSIIAEGLVEVIEVPHTKSKGSGWVKCIRLIPQAGKATTTGRSQALVHQPEAIHMAEISEEDLDEVSENVNSGLQANLTLQHQIVSALEDAGPAGLRLTELEELLGGTDRRTLELALIRLEAAPYPPELAHKAISHAIETSGRERRYRYYMRSLYTTTFPQDKTYKPLDESQAGALGPIDFSLFWDNQRDVHRHVDGMKGGEPIEDVENEDLKPTKPKRVKKGRVNPIMPDGKVKIGRPRKNSDELKRPRKKPKKSSTMEVEPSAATEVEVDATGKCLFKPKTKKCGTKRKAGEEPSESNEPTSVTKRQRTRRAPQDILEDSPIASATADDPTIELAPLMLEMPTAVAEMVHIESNVSSPLTELSSDPLSRPPSPLPGLVVEPTPTLDMVIPHATTTVGIDSIKAAPAHNAAETPTRNAPLRALKPKAPKTNVSHLLREKEFMILLQESGGILSINVKDFGEAHSTLVQRLHTSGEPTSCAPDVVPDKRTVLATFAKMESKGLVKTVKTITKTALGVQRPVTIGYVVDLPGEVLNEYLAEVGRNPLRSHAVAIKKVDDAMSYDEANGTRPSLPLQLLSLHDPGDREERWMKNENRADQLFGYDDETIRDVLLSETTTLAQSYGYIVPKAMRCRQLHLLATQAFESDISSPAIVSREHRILNLSFFHEDLAVQDYCSLVSVLAKSDQLAQLLQTEDGKRTGLTRLPTSLYNEMQINRPRGRCRILSILETLRSLNLVVPLRPSTTANPWIQCTSSNKYPNAFDRSPLSGWSSSTPSEAPVYWRFSTTAPVHLWSLHLSDPPFWKDMSILTVYECIEYWATLKQVAISTDVARGIHSSTSESLTGPLQSTSEGVACLNRLVSWKENYILTWHQERFIKRIVTDEAWKTDDEEAQEAKISRICRVTTANRQAVELYIPRAIDQHVKSQSRQPRKAKTEDDLERIRAAKATVQQRASRAKAARLEEWKALVQKVHPQEIPRALALRLARVRNGYMSALTIQGQEWETSISQAIRDYHMASGLAVVLPATSFHHVPTTGSTTQLRPPAFEHRKSVQTIIDEMGPPIGDHVVHKSKKKKKKRKSKAGADPVSSEDESPVDHGLTPSGTPRMRRRWAWTAEHEDLAKDAYVVIKARVKRLKARLDWSPLEQVFPAIPRNSVRQRLGRWLEDPQAASYLGRLETAWLELWHQYCGTDHLPDPYPESTLDWPIIAHIEFLRKHIDKRVVRAGYTRPEPDETFNLPKTVEDMEAMFDVIDDRPSEPLFNHITNTQVDEGRERQFNAIAFSTVPEQTPDSLEYSDDHQRVAESALKMVFGTPKTYYDADQAAMILRDLGEDLVAVTRVNLLARGVLSRQIKLGKHGPGRTLKIAEANQDLLGGPIGEQVFHDAVDFMDGLIREFGRGVDIAAGPSVDEWALEAPDGDMAALLELVSQHRVQFTVDTSGPQTHRRTLEYQSKKVVDDQIETVIQYTVELSEPSHTTADTSGQPNASTTAPIPYLMQPFLPHGTRRDGRSACCGLQVAGVIDCEACVSEDTQRVLVSSSEYDRADIERIINAVVTRAEGGLPFVDIQNIGLEEPDRAEELVRKILDVKAPPFVRVGYNEGLLVSVYSLDCWTVPISAESPARVLPRRWLDIWGEQIPSLRTLTTQAILGVVTLHPGITQDEVLWRLRHVYDRPEVDEVIRGLCADNRLTQRQALVDSVSAFEKHRFLFINGLGRWYWRN